MIHQVTSGGTLSRVFKFPVSNFNMHKSILVKFQSLGKHLKFVEIFMISLIKIFDMNSTLFAHTNMQLLCCVTGLCDMMLY